jgi:hypothetical protein
MYYTSDMNHLVDKEGNISATSPKQSRELASFLALVIDAKTKKKNSTSSKDAIRCFKKRCTGEINYKIDEETIQIIWECSKCDNAGSISNWLDTKWDNSR